MADVAEVLTWTPFVSAAIWFGLAGYEIRHERYRTWTEVFFLALAASAGAYTAIDPIFFHAPSAQIARLAAVASLSCVTFMAFFLFLYGVALASRFRRWLVVTVVPLVAVLTFIPTSILAGVVHLSTAGGLWAAQYDVPFFAVWFLFALALVIGGVLGVYRTYRIIRGQSQRLARRLQAIVAAFLVAMILGAATNAVAGLSDIQVVPLFSTTLALPGLLLFLAVSPEALGSLESILLRWQAPTYEVKGAILTFSDGTLIGSRVLPGETFVDEDLFAATLDLIQNFMRSSVTMFRGKWLRTIRHGDRVLVMERGAFTFLTLVLRGAESDPLRRFMIERLHAWEAQNEEVLRHWRGVAADSEGTNELLSEMFLTSDARAHA